MKKISKRRKIMTLLLAIFSIFGFSGCNVVDESDQTAEAVTGAYYSVENFFVGCYEKMQNFLVDGYEKVQDQFIEWFFAKDGETAEDAKDRLEQNK